MVLRIPPPNLPPIGPDGNWTPEWQRFFTHQLVPTVNDTVTAQAQSLTTVNPTIANVLLADS